MYLMTPTGYVGVINFVFFCQFKSTSEPYFNVKS